MRAGLGRLRQGFQHQGLALCIACRLLSDRSADGRIDGNLALALQWADAAPVIKQLRQCAK